MDAPAIQQHQPASHVSGLPWESNLQVQSSLQMGAALAASGHSLRRDPEPEPPSHTVPEREPQRNHERENNDYRCFRPLSFKATCYTPVDNKHKSTG